jgi:hypothetical protein
MEKPLGGIVLNAFFFKLQTVCEEMFQIANREIGDHESELSRKLIMVAVVARVFVQP